MARTTWKTDPTHTDIQFSAKHMMVTTVRGKFASVDGTVVLDEDAPAASSGTFSVDTASLNTGVEQRDGHLRSTDFLDADAHPRITFATTAVEPRGGNDYRVTGDLAIRGVTRPATFDVTFLGLYQGMNGARRAGFRATAKLNREDWGLTWNVALETGGWLVSKDIRLEIDVALEEAAAAGSRPDAVSTAA
ncbi:MAG: YceI family protein [Chloroflexota bacterium]